MLTGAASVITHQLSLKGKAAADVAEVAKHLNITHDVRDAENAGRNRGMQSYNRNLPYNAGMSWNVSKFG